MPIRPENRARYPKDGPAVFPRGRCLVSTTTSTEYAIRYEDGCLSPDTTESRDEAERYVQRAEGETVARRAVSCGDVGVTYGEWTEVAS